MTSTTQTPSSTGAEDVSWNLDDLVGGDGEAGARSLLERAADTARSLSEKARGKVATADAAALATWLDELAEVNEHIGRAGSWASLRYAVDTAEPAYGAFVAEVQERAAQLSAAMVWFELEWLDVDDAAADTMLADPALAAHRHHLETMRLRKPHVLDEATEEVLAQKSPAGRSAWVRLFTEQTSAIRVTLDGTEVPLPTALSKINHNDRDVRADAAAAITEGLAPGLRTRAYLFNTLLQDKAIDDRIRGYPTWITAWNQQNETADASVDALVEAVVSRYDIPQRWYGLKAKVLGVDRLADYDRSSSMGTTESFVPWDEACATVRDAYASFSPELAGIVDRFLAEGWIDAPVRENKRGGAFCSYTVPSHHPYVFLNYTATPGDVMTLAHELGHAVHGYLAREQGVFLQATPLSVAETASVFGETVTFERLLSQVDDPAERFALLAQHVEGNIATVFRQVSMNRFEDAVHNHRRDVGELSVDDFNGHWADTQQAMFGDAVEVTEGYRTWWSYIPHFIGTPGYVYAYAYGQLLALSVYAQYRDQGDGFVSNYLEMLSAGGSQWPAELGKIVDCDLDDPGFWAAGLDIVDAAVTRAEQAAIAAGRIA